MWGASIRSNKLRPGFTAVSNGFLAVAPLPRKRSPLGAAGNSVSRMGCPAAFAPSNSRMARLADETDAYVTNAVPVERPERSYLRERNVTGAMRVKRS